MDNSAFNTHAFPQTVSGQYDIWLATRFRVSASSHYEASTQAVAWLTKRLSSEAGDADSGSDAGSVAVTISAQTLHEAAVLAIKLLALEEKGGEALRRVEQLRAEVDSQALHAKFSLPDLVSR